MSWLQRRVEDSHGVLLDPRNAQQLHRTCMATAYSHAKTVVVPVVEKLGSMSIFLLNACVPTKTDLAMQH